MYVAKAGLEILGSSCPSAQPSKKLGLQVYAAIWQELVTSREDSEHSHPFCMTWRTSPDNKHGKFGCEVPNYSFNRKTSLYPLV